MIREIKILDSGIDRYIIDPKTINLGRMYDNEADTISIIRPDAEKNSICTMIITDMDGKVIDHIIMKDNTYKITNAISLNSLVQIGFSFSKADGYIKGSEIILGKFLPAPKPDGFIPPEPEQKKNIDYLIENAITKFTNELVNYYLKSETYSQKEIDDLIKKEIAQITATQIRNKAPNLVINATTETLQAVATQYIVDNYSRQPQEFDGLYLTMTDHDNQVVEYAYHNEAWVNVGFDKVDLSNYMDLLTEQRVGGRKIFEDETSFENEANFENGLTVDDSVITATDTSKDMVIKYSADEIVRETGSGENAKTYNYKFPDTSGTFVTESEIAYLEYPSYIEITPSSATNGTFAEDDFNALNEHIDIKIKLNGEYYERQDEDNIKGLVSYIHKGWNGKTDQTKSINITTSTRAWTLVVGQVDKTPTKDSANMVESGGVFTAIDTITPTYQKTDNGVTVISIGNYLKMSKTFTITGNTEQVWNFPLQFDSEPLCWCNSEADGQSSNNSAAVTQHNTLTMTVRVCGANSTVTMFAEGIKNK